ncbi:MAG: CrcB family protein [Arachnia sp.]
MGQVGNTRLLPYVGFIFAGCTLGTLTRAGLEGAFPTPAGHWPWATFWINIVGSLVLGVLLEALSVAGDDTGWRRAVRLGVGTGVIGGFTTYSTYVLETDQLARGGAPVLGVAYALVSIVVGLAAAGAGMAAVASLERRALAREEAA